MVTPQLRRTVVELLANKLRVNYLELFYFRCMFIHVFGLDRFKKFARLGNSLLISDVIISISATMRSERTSDDLANPDYANSAIARIFSISESTLRGILKRRIVSKICTHKKNRASAFGPR